MSLLTSYSHATHAPAWYSHAELKQGPWTGSQVERVQGETNKQTRINWQVNWVLARQQAFPTRSSSPDSTHCLNQLLSFYYVEGICSQANVQVSTWLCSYTLHNCILYVIRLYKQHRNGKQGVAEICNYIYYFCYWYLHTKINNIHTRGSLSAYHTFHTIIYHLEKQCYIISLI